MKALNPHSTKHSSWAYAEQHPGQDPVLDAARLRGADLGVIPVSEGTAAALTVLAAAAQASTLVELGTGVGVSGIALLRGAAPDAVLTSIDPNPDHQHAAREAFREEGLTAARTRLITGRAGHVLPRLTTAAYDLVLVDADAEQTPGYLDEALRLMRPGGVLIINDALDHDRVPRPAVREPGTQALRAVEQQLIADDRLVTALLPTGTGLMTAVKR